MGGTTIRRLVALGAIMLLAAACGDSGGEDAGGGAAADTGTAGGARGGYYGGGGAGTETGPTAPTGSTGETGDAAAGSAHVSVALNNYLFDPARIEVASGATIDLQNANANTPHTFTVRGTGIDVSLEPLTSDTAAIDLAPGSYTVFCRLHTSFDMEAALTVT